MILKLVQYRQLEICTQFSEINQQHKKGLLISFSGVINFLPSPEGRPWACPNIKASLCGVVYKVV